MADQNDVLRVDVIGDVDAVQTIVNTYQFVQTSSGSTTDSELLDDIEDIVDAILVIIKAIMTATTLIRRFKVFNVTSGLLVGERTLAAAVAGTGGTSPAPYQVAHVVNFPTNVPRVIMRKYIGTVDEAQIGAGGKPGSGALAVSASFIALMIAEFSETNGTYHYGYLSPKTSSFHKATEGNASTLFGTRRSRKIGQGS